jgi:hypothetical protein
MYISECIQALFSIIGFINYTFSNVLVYIFSIEINFNVAPGDKRFSFVGWGKGAPEKKGGGGHEILSHT